ncbi:hypothetical protein IQ230_25630 [Gloeocapsopsis crepidinum LEGE 06123]|uniref:Uncharacterized protein n=1 Tax=Gloeocapsopsis crepidinum LEGE 06123 TaxID=588587 RepID=A0ABR9UZ95_9CHRO|nr:hypothetical protein [Gloeocapsopsis crepidinum]MBE9193637.1 hypothetical protein [Gloeocapsopsis crepidinum LEGE 06123]
MEVVPPVDQQAKANLRQVWDKFLEDKQRHVKAKTWDEYLNFTALLDKLGDRLNFDALQTKEALLKITTIDQTRRMLQYLSAACN